MSDLKHFTRKEMSDAENAVTSLAEATGLSLEETTNIIIDGIAMKFKGKLDPKYQELVDELRATFDAY